MQLKNKLRIESTLKKIYLYGISKQLYDAFFLIKLEKGRFLSCFFLDIFNLFPDWFILARLRAYILFIVGFKIEKPGTSSIRKNFFAEFPRNVHIGKNVVINRDVYFCSNDNITIGNNVRIAFGVRIINISHSGSGRDVIDHYEPVIIKDNCSIYANAIILPGSILEHGVNISAGAVISGETKPGGVYGGNPARLIKTRDEYLDMKFDE